VSLWFRQINAQYAFGKKKVVKVYKYDGYWLDIGRPDDYMQAIEEFDKTKEKFLPAK